MRKSCSCWIRIELGLIITVNGPGERKLHNRIRLSGFFFALKQQKICQKLYCVDFEWRILTGCWYNVIIDTCGDHTSILSEFTERWLRNYWRELETFDLNTCSETQRQRKKISHKFSNYSINSILMEKKLWWSMKLMLYLLCTDAHQRIVEANSEFNWVSTKYIKFSFAERCDEEIF